MGIEPADLVAIEAIHQLKARYFRLMDTKQWDAWGEVFATDARMVIPENGLTLEGRAAIVEGVRSVIGPSVTVHHGHMPEIELTSDTTATGIWAMEDELWWPEGSPIRYMHGYGHYHETYREDDGGWRIASLTLTRLHRIFDMAPTNAG